MSMKAKITKIEPFRSQREGTEHLDVYFDIIDGEEVVASRRELFPETVEGEEIEATLKQIATAFASDQKLAAETAEREASAAKARQTIEALTGKEIE